VNTITVHLPDSFDDVMTVAVSDPPSPSIDDVGRLGFIVGLLAYACILAGRADVKDEVIVLNEPS